MPVAPSCYSGYPNGLAAGLGLTQPQFTVSFALYAAEGFTFHDPSYSHQTIPRWILDLMNRTAGYDEFAMADGHAGNIELRVELTRDESGDHHGMVVRASGPERLAVGQPKIVSSTTWFVLRLPTEYISEKLFEDAASELVGRFNNGWICR